MLTNLVIVYFKNLSEFNKGYPQRLHCTYVCNFDMLLEMGTLTFENSVETEYVGIKHTLRKFRTFLEITSLNIVILSVFFQR